MNMSDYHLDCEHANMYTYMYKHKILCIKSNFKVTITSENSI